MRREEIQHLLGGYAAGTLTPAEQKLLFDAAMEDQSLFDALADEQSLKELLDDPEARGYLRAALEEAPARQRAWWPKVAGASALAAVLTVVTVIGIRQMPSDTKPTEVARNTPATPPAVSQPQPRETAAAAVPKAPKKAVAAPAAKPAAAVESKESEEKREVVAVAAPPPPPPPAPVRAPVPVVAAEPREKELAKAAPESAPILMPGRAAGAVNVQLSASQLFLTQYRQNFLPASDAASGGSQVFRDNSSQQRMQKQSQAPEDRAMMNRRPAAAVPQAQSTPVAAVNRGIRYQILRRNSQGQFVQTRLDTRFEAGDEIVLQVEKNAPGAVLVLAGAAPLTLSQQSASSAQTAPLKLTAGALDLSIVFSEAPPTPAASALLPQGQLTEQSGNLMYVVLPGAVPNPVVAKLRITVYP